MQYIFHVLAAIALLIACKEGSDIYRPKTPIIETMVFLTFLICGQIARVAAILGEARDRIRERDRGIPSRAFVETKTEEPHA